MNHNEFEDADYYDDDFEELEDLEEYISDDEEDADNRITQKAGEKEMNEVIGEYKHFLETKPEKLGNTSKLSTITEQNIESSGGSGIRDSQGPRKIASSLEEKKIRMKKNCIEILGEKKFKEVHKYLSHHRKKQTPERKVRLSLISSRFRNILKRNTRSLT